MLQLSQLSKVTFWMVQIVHFTQVFSKGDVSCGGHYAPTCAECPQGNGAAWCNGECKWSYNTNECLLDSVQCGGGATASKCADCPSGAGGCGNTDCAWHTSTNLCRDALSDEVRTASVHLVYDNSVIYPLKGKPAWWFQRVIPTDSADTTYWSSNGHAFGYGGIQNPDSTTGRVIFSLWDQGGCDQDFGECETANLAQTVACGEGVTCTGFGGEGTGRKSYYDREAFVVDEPHYFVTQAVYLGGRRMEYTGYFYENEKWRLLSRIQVSTDANEKWWLDGMYSFVEQWYKGQTTLPRGGLFGPSFLATTDGTNFVQVDSAMFTHGYLENHQHVNAWQEGSNLQYAVGIETGGDVTPTVVYGHNFDYMSVQPYPELESFQERIPCLNAAASNKNDIEQCLLTTTSTSPTASSISPTASSTSPTITSFSPTTTSFSPTASSTLPTASSNLPTASSTSPSGLDELLTSVFEAFAGLLLMCVN